MTTGITTAQLPTELTRLTLVQAMEMLRRKAISPVELVQAFVARIERLNPALNAFITVTAEQALQQARQAEAEIDVTNSCCGIDTHAATAVSPLSIHSRAWNSNRCICGKNTALDARAVFISARTPLATVRYWVRANASGRIAMHIQNRLLRADFI